MGKLKALITIAIMATGLWYLWYWVPVKWNNGQFEEGLDDIARRESYNRKSDDDIKQIVINKAKSFDIIVKEDQITLTHSTDGLGITVHYHAHFDFPVFPYDKDFVVASMNRRI